MKINIFYLVSSYFLILINLVGKFENIIYQSTHFFLSTITF